MPGKIFVNYRRDDTRDMAARIRDRLAATFGDANIFMDVDNLLAGQRFDKELEKALGETDVFLAVVGPRWLELLAERQRSGEHDYVREEIAGALHRGIVVVPVVVERTSLPRADALPEDIRDLVLHQKHTVTHDRFGSDVADLAEAIRFARRAARAGAGGRGSAVRRFGTAGLVALMLLVGALTYQLVGPGVAVDVRPQQQGHADKAKAEAAEKARNEEVSRVAAEAAARKKAAEEARAKRESEEAERQRHAKAEQDRKRAEDRWKLFETLLTTPEASEEYQPLPVAYLAAPYQRDLIGLSETFGFGRTSPPAESLFTRLTKPDGEPWHGYRVELFRGPPWQNKRLSYHGKLLGVGGSEHLLPSLYIFVPESRPVRVSKLRTFGSDAWHEKPDYFSVLSDTSFHLEGIPKPPLPDGVGAEIIACVNKRSRTPVCDGKSGAVIEDPLSGLPSLLMMSRGGPPEWLKKIPTEICVDRQKGLAVWAPESSQPIYLDQAAGDRWCSAILILNYVLLREEGLRIGSGEGKKQLDSRFAPDKGWRMWAERPRAIKVPTKDIWVQRIVLYPPAGR